MQEKTWRLEFIFLKQTKTITKTSDRQKIQGLYPLIQLQKLKIKSSFENFCKRLKTNKLSTKLKKYSTRPILKTPGMRQMSCKLSLKNRVNSSNQSERDIRLQGYLNLNKGGQLEILYPQQCQINKIPLLLCSGQSLMHKYSWVVPGFEQQGAIGNRVCQSKSRIGLGPPDLKIAKISV